MANAKKKKKAPGASQLEAVIVHGHDGARIEVYVEDRWIALDTYDVTGDRTLVLLPAGRARRVRDAIDRVLRIAPARVRRTR